MGDLGVIVNPKAIQKNRLLNKLICLDSVDSTNKYLSRNNCASGTVVVSAIQTGGMGKHGADWSSPKGGLWFSYIIRRKIKRPYDFVILSSVAVCEAMEALGLKPEIKWPNDILLGGRKVSGILIENDHYNGRIITGIGINVNNRVPAGIKAVSMASALGRKADIGAFFLFVLKKMDRYMCRLKILRPEIIRKWIYRQKNLEGRAVSVAGKKYTVIKAGRDGLLVSDEKGREKNIRGEVFFA